MAHLVLNLTYVNDQNNERVIDIEAARKIAQMEKDGEDPGKVLEFRQQAEAQRLADIKVGKAHVPWGATLRFDCDPKNIDPPFTTDGTENGLPKMVYRYTFRGKGDGWAGAHKSKKYVSGEGPLNIRREDRFYATHGTAIWFKIPKSLEDYTGHKLDVTAEYDDNGNLVKSGTVSVIVS